MGNASEKEQQLLGRKMPLLCVKLRGMCVRVQVGGVQSYT